MYSIKILQVTNSISSIFQSMNISFQEKDFYAYSTFVIFSTRLCKIFILQFIQCVKINSFEGLEIWLLLLDVLPEKKSVNTIMQNRIKLVRLTKVAALFC